MVVHGILSFRDARVIICRRKFKCFNLDGYIQSTKWWGWYNEEIHSRLLSVICEQYLNFAVAQFHKTERLCVLSQKFIVRINVLRNVNHLDISGVQVRSDANEIHLSLRKTRFCPLFHCLHSLMKNQGVKAEKKIILMHSLIASKIIKFTHNYKDIYNGKNRTQNHEIFLTLIASVYAFQTSLRIYFMNFCTFSKVFEASFKNDARFSRKCDPIKWQKKQF